MQVELILNVLWAAISLTLLCLWLRFACSRERSLRVVQIAALLLVVALLLPCISMTDDLAATQGTFENDCRIRRLQDGYALDVVLFETALLVPPAIGLPPETNQVIWLETTTGVKHLADFYTPVIDNRPPPQA